MGIFKKKTSYMTMVTERGNGVYQWDGKLYRSDIVRACIRPKAKAMGKLVAKHIRKNAKGIEVNPEPYIRFLLEEPNPFMSGQVMQEKVAVQLSLNGNAFILILRDEFGNPCGLYPLPASAVEAVYANELLYLKFAFENGKQTIFDYRDIIHLRNDFGNNDIFGESPAPALSGLMEVIGTTDKSVVNAIKNSSVVSWLLKYHSTLRPEDLKRNVSEFVKNYLTVGDGSIGAAGVDAKAEAERIEPKDYVPNAAVTDKTVTRLYAFFNTNEKIVRSVATEDEWNTYYELVIEPEAMQASNEYTRKLFTRKERAFGNSIIFEASNLSCASLSTKLALQAMVDRGALTPDEWRATMNLAPIPGGDVPLRRKDTGTVTEKGGD